ncbi:MAG: YfiM family protein [Saprospiraceae bacterium]|nr:YfiM family protein [Saprospiraceae bacterium]MCF8249463.1 YfiM family protein [Saprospiraceae bacterium]MCF8279117.1 YfiM family protein [Bacteroidales bacterium]MCF8311592.1 YfiM family protein [Saprospiraceae bacterium]MCF8440082.1 YfiM family protein [Saprospiraceae bacterium]
MKALTLLGFLEIFLFVLCLPATSNAQAPQPDSIIQTIKFLSLQPAPQFDKRRFWAVTGTGAAVYSGLSVALWKAWYKDYPLTKFHPFNDWGEWEHMDKSGHFFSTWTGCSYAFDGARWTGMSRRHAMWTSVGVGMGIMTTFEVMDGFSEEWGFSFADMAFNTMGAGLFIGQEIAWQEQRIQLKVSGIRPGYSQQPLYSEDGSQVTTLDERAAGLYGTTLFHVLLKDYNALTTWASVNVHSFLPNKKASKFPAWLNVAVGYGAGNLYGGYENKWVTEDGVVFELDPERYPRYRQYYLSLDVDWTRIPTRHRWLKVSLRALNFLKVPAPVLEFNSLGKAHFHYLHW